MCKIYILHYNNSPSILKSIFKEEPVLSDTMNMNADPSAADSIEITTEKHIHLSCCTPSTQTSSSHSSTNAVFL